MEADQLLVSLSFPWNEERLGWGVPEADPKPHVGVGEVYLLQVYQAYPWVRQEYPPYNAAKGAAKMHYLFRRLSGSGLVEIAPSEVED